MSPLEPGAYEARTTLRARKVLLRHRLESAMHNIHEQRSRLNRVTAVFEDRALSFILAKGTTLEELSDRLADLGRHNGCPVAITVKFGCRRARRGPSPDPAARLR